MKDFEKFLDSNNLDEIKSGVFTSLIDVKMTDKEKEAIGAMCYGMIIDLLGDYHRWLHSEEA